MPDDRYDAPLDDRKRLWIKVVELRARGMKWREIMEYMGLPLYTLRRYYQRGIMLIRYYPNTAASPKARAFAAKAYDPTPRDEKREARRLAEREGMVFHNGLWLEPENVHGRG